MLIVDGYNVINARRSGRGSLSRDTLADAREQLIEDLVDYAGFSGQQVVLVFDAWMSDRASRNEERRGDVTVVFTQRGEIADRYIERLCDDLASDIDLRRVEVRVASSDGLEQTIVLGRGATRLSARELMYEMEQTRAAGSRWVAQRPTPRRNPISDRLSPEVREKLEEMRKNMKE